MNQPRYGENRPEQPAEESDQASEGGGGDKPPRKPREASPVLTVVWGVFWLLVLGTAAAAGLTWLWRLVLGLA